MDRSHHYQMTALLALAMASGVCAKPLPESGKFDLICPTHSRTVKTYNPERIGYVSYSGPPYFFALGRYSLDLKRGVFRESGWPVLSVSPVRANKHGFLLTWERGDGIARFNVRTNRYYSRVVASASLDDVAIAQCRRGAFSGIAANARVIGRR